MRTNSVQLIGFVANDLKEQKASSGDKKVIIRVATSESYTDKTGNTAWSTSWHDVVAWDEVGHFASCNFVKGSKILVQGSIHYRTYPDLHGHKRYVTEIKALALQNLDR